MNEVFQRIADLGIVPVIKIDRPEQAEPLANAFCAGGLPLMEVTFRTEHAAEAIRVISKRIPEMLVGAGTVITCEQVDRALEAGARFMVSPGLNEKVVRYCADKNVPIIPGCSNPSDVERAIECGLQTVKFFPAESLGGLNTIKAISAPYPQIKFVPTGGISVKNINEYLAYDKVLACGGSWLAPSDMLASGDFAGITAVVREAVSLVLGFTLKHIGINEANEEVAMNTAKAFASFMFAAVKPGNSSIFAGTSVEVMKKPFRGENGHIAFGVNNVSRAVAYLAQNGCSVDMESAAYDESGRMKVVYLKDEIGGFAVHLVRN